MHVLTERGSLGRMEPDERAAVASAARALVANVTIIKAAARLLEGYWDRLTEDERNRMLSDITAHADAIQELVDGLVHGLPAELRRIVDLRPAEAPVASVEAGAEP